MNIDDFILTEEEALDLKSLKDDFNIRYHESPFKKALLLKEIKEYSLIFDEENLPLSKYLSEDDVATSGYLIPEFSSMELWLIREFWMHYIVNPEKDIAEIYEFQQDSWFWKINDFVPHRLSNPRLYYSLALIYCKYLDWLSRFKDLGMTQSELALIMVYESKTLISDKSKLYQIWARYSSKINRTGTVDSDLKNKNKIKLLEKVIGRLSGEAKVNAENDLKELKINIENQGFV